MKRVMLVRHPEPLIEIDVSAVEWRLTPQGVESPKRLAAVLAHHGPTVTEIRT